MKELLYKITKGIYEKDLLKKDLELIETLTKLKVIKKKSGIIKLDSSYRVGVIDISRTNTGYLKTFDPKYTKDILIEPHDLNNASKGDIVIAKRVYSKNSRPKAKVIHILKKEFDYIVVYLTKVGDEIVAKNIKTNLTTTIAASKKSLKQLPKNCVLKIDSYTSMVVEVLGVLDDPKVDEKISLALYNKSNEFSKECKLEAKSYGKFVDKSMYPKRVDLTDLPFCTIDPPDAKDFDDAIYFDLKTHTLYVAIADVSEYVPSMSHIDKEARKRGFSIYFPHIAIPMLPRELSENICSLKPNEDRLAFVYKIKLNPKTYESTKEELFEAIICSKKRYTYDKIDQYLENDLSGCDRVDKEILNFLLPLHDILKKVRKKRLQSGCDFSSLEVRMKLDEKQNLISTTYEKETPSHKLIEDAMLLANQAAAKALQRGVFRVHDKPSIDSINEMLNDLESIGIYSSDEDDIYKQIQNLQSQAKEKNLKAEVDKLIIKAQKKAIYHHENRGHFGLGFKYYTHFTSPIRRYSDLVVHRLLKTILKKDTKQNKFLLKDIDAIALEVSELEKESNKVAWDFMDRKYARWAAKNIGKKLNATISDTKKDPIAIVNDKEIVGMRLFLIDSDTDLFEKVEVELLQADIATTKIIAKITKRLESF